MRFKDEELEKLFNIACNTEHRLIQDVHFGQIEKDLRQYKDFESACANFISAVENKIYPAVDPNEIHELKKKIETLQIEADKYNDLYPKYIELKQRDTQEPCGNEWRLDLDIMADPMMDYPWKFCPMCGRALEGK